MLLLCQMLLLKEPKVNLVASSLKDTGKEEIDLKLKNTDIESLSAGEYNRLRLAMMCLNAKVTHSEGIIVLDEIDANLSGEESEGVAKILKSLSKNYQIFAVSHQPHMPILADWHYLVCKERDRGKVELLDKENRALEIARMISGSEITKESLDFAYKKLGQIT